MRRFSLTSPTAHRLPDIRRQTNKLVNTVEDLVAKVTDSKRFKRSLKFKNSFIHQVVITTRVDVLSYFLSL